MTNVVTNIVEEVMPHFEGYVYPNEATQQPLWSVLIVLYPYITGLVAGAFIMASLVRVFNVKALEPVYRLSLLTAFAFLLCAPLAAAVPPRASGALLRGDDDAAPDLADGDLRLRLCLVPDGGAAAGVVVRLPAGLRRSGPRPRRASRACFIASSRSGVTDESDEAVALDHKIGHILSIVGIPSAFLLHGYVGFIFGSVKANPWWGNVLMPIIFIMSAMVSGIALCVFNYMVLSWIRRRTVDMKCLDVMGMFLFYALVVDAAIEALDWIHRIYSAEEGFQVMQYMAREKLFYTLSLGQVAFGTLVPLLLLGALQLVRRRVPELQRRRMYFASATVDPDRRAGDALERRHRRPALLQEPAGRDGLQDGICRAGRLAYGRGAAAACRSLY